MKHYNHIIRFAVILLLVVLGFVGVRSYLVPDSFGTYGSYSYGFHRGASDAEQAALPALFQESEKCAGCHEKQATAWAAEGHQSVTCEACHGPWQAHNNNTKETVVKDASVEACLLCHQQLAARPAAFPQLPGFKEHLTAQEIELEEGMTCMECHDPHEPM